MPNRVGTALLSTALLLVNFHAGAVTNVGKVEAFGYPPGGAFQLLRLSGGAGRGGRETKGGDEGGRGGCNGGRRGNKGSGGGSGSSPSIVPSGAKGGGGNVARVEVRDQSAG
ncbi:hypothetical protein T484DRAFT_2688479 [Baffinella frigidus]|nr:hypothetical protein T484DRAFT_2688479 [Cryptophyta sp. CCMP2293]